MRIACDQRWISGRRYHVSTKSIQKQIIKYNIKSKYPGEYSTITKVGSEKPLASKSSVIQKQLPPHFLSNLQASET